MQDVIYSLPEYQDTFINSQERVVSIIGAKGSSKTWTGARFVLVQLTVQPNTQGLVMFNTLQQARDIFFQDIEPVLKELCWPFSFNEQKMVLKCLGSIVHFRSAEPDAVKKIESVAYHWGWADEASYYDPSALKTFVSRIRKGLALVRVTSMPDEPDAFIYSFLEKLGGKMYEISLKDNPDREFAERYEKFLTATYSGAELERYLSGKRVSLSGLGLFATENSQRGAYPYEIDDDIYLVWDFNVEFRAVSAWQEIGKNEKAMPIMACVDSWKLTGATVQEDAVYLSQHLKNHKGRLFLHGDASGESRSAGTTQSMWKMVRKEFEKIFTNIRYIVPTKNPPVKDTIQCLNWALREGLVKFDSQESHTYSSLSAIKADRYGEIDKSMDYKANSTARSHHGDTARYLAFHIYQYIYPGGSGGWWVV